MKKVKPIKSNDIIHYYLGCQFRFTWNDGDIIEGVIEVLNDNGFLCGTPKGGDIKKSDDWFEINDFRKEGKLELILTHPCDMSAHQKQAYRNLCKRVPGTNGYTNKVWIVDTPKSIHYLILQDVDAFDLIETGQAIDRKTGKTGVFIEPQEEIPTEQPDIDILKEIEDINRLRNSKPYQFARDLRPLTKEDEK